MEIIKREVVCCAVCPFLLFDMMEDNCNLNGKSISAKEVNIIPKWCPLRKNDILVTLNQ